MTNWKCMKCGQEVIADTNPTDNFVNWSDGHKCVFKMEVIK